MTKIFFCISTLDFLNANKLRSCAKTNIHEYVCTQISFIFSFTIVQNPSFNYKNNLKGHIQINILFSPPY